MGEPGHVDRSAAVVGEDERLDPLQGGEPRSLQRRWHLQAGIAPAQGVGVPRSRDRARVHAGHVRAEPLHDLEVLRERVLLVGGHHEHRVRLQRAVEVAAEVLGDEVAPPAHERRVHGEGPGERRGRDEGHECEPQRPWHPGAEHEDQESPDPDAGHEEGDEIQRQQPEVVLAAPQVDEGQERRGQRDHRDEGEQEALPAPQPREAEEQAEEAHREQLVPELRGERREAIRGEAEALPLAAPLHPGHVPEERGEARHVAERRLRVRAGGPRQVQVGQEGGGGPGERRGRHQAAVAQCRPLRPGEPGEGGQEHHRDGVVAAGESESTRQQEDEGPLVAASVRARGGPPRRVSGRGTG